LDILIKLEPSKDEWWGQGFDQENVRLKHRVSFLIKDTLIKDSPINDSERVLG